MKSALAPIILFAYNRPWHTKQVLSALKNNVLAKESILHIFVDGPKYGADEETIKQINDVRGIIMEEQWCGEVHFSISNKNIGCRDSILAGISQIINIFGKAIILEDDIITSPLFLTFMNNALNYYVDRKSVFSISGWNMPPDILQIPADYPYDVYVSQRILNWGWATWKDRWDQINWNWDFVPEFIKDRNKTNAFNRGGEDMTQMLFDMYRKKIDAWDIQFAYAHFANHAVSIVPCKSYVNNIGMDGSGMHCKPNNRLNNNIEFAVRDPKFIDILYEDKRIINNFKQAFSSNILKRRKSTMQEMIRSFLYKNKKIKNKNVYT